MRGGGGHVLEVMSVHHQVMSVPPLAGQDGAEAPGATGQILTMNRGGVSPRRGGWLTEPSGIVWGSPLEPFALHEWLQLESQNSCFGGGAVLREHRLWGSVEEVLPPGDVVGAPPTRITWLGVQG